MAEGKVCKLGLARFMVKPSTETMAVLSFLYLVVAKLNRQQDVKRNWMNPSRLLLEMGILKSRSSSK